MLAVVAAVSLNTAAMAQQASRGDRFSKIPAQRGTTRGRVPGKIVVPPGRAPNTNERPKRTEAEKLAAKMKEIRARATAASSTVFIDRNITLTPTDVITKRLIFEGRTSTGVTFNFNGATLDGGRKGSVNYGKDMIEVRSRKTGNTWGRPENILVQKGTIIGSVRVWGMGTNGEAAAIKESSRREETNSKHVRRVEFSKSCRALLALQR